MKDAFEVQHQLDNFCCRLIRDDIDDLKRRIKAGNAETYFAMENKLIREEDPKIMLTILSYFYPREERWRLSYTEVYQYEGAICTLQWLLAHHNHELVDYLVSDRFEQAVNIPMTSVAHDRRVNGSKEMGSGKLGDRKDQGSPILYRNTKKIKKQVDRLEILYHLQPYHFLKSGLGEGVVKITDDPLLEKEQIRFLKHAKLVHEEYWKFAQVVNAFAKKELPKKFRDEPLDIIKAERVFGAICALRWFFSEEDNSLATFLKFTAQNIAPVKR